jgi:hypothetical protein
MTAVKLIVALASALVFAVVGLAACSAPAERTGHVSMPTFAPTTAPAALIVLDHPVPVTVTRTVRAVPQVAVQAPVPRPAPVTVTRIVPVPAFRPAPAPVRTSATSRSVVRSTAVRPAPVASGRPSAVCKDGTLSYSAHRSGTCSGHHGVARWL